jgi:hypothetical protein
MSIKKFLNSIYQPSKQAIAFLIALAGLFTIVKGFDLYVEHLVEKKTQNSDFIKSLVSKVRPTLIFNSSEAILVDLGAKEYIDHVEVTEGPWDDLKTDSEGKEFNLVSKVVVFAKEVLPRAPMLETLGGNEVHLTATPGKNNSWEYSIKIGGAHYKGEPLLYRLEILR